MKSQLYSLGPKLHMKLLVSELQFMVGMHAGTIKCLICTDFLAWVMSVIVVKRQLDSNCTKSLAEVPTCLLQIRH